jgi:hypothetical protein
MILLKKILGLFGKNAGSDSTEEYQAQFKSKTNANNVSTPQQSKGSPASLGAFDVIVVGVSFYQEALEKICGNKREEGHALFMEATIVPHDDNPHDAHAVRVEIGGKMVGHLGRKNAIIWRSKMISDNHSGAIRCPAKIVWDRSYDRAGSYGVWLDLDLTLPDSKPEPNASQSRSVSHNQSDHIEFLVKKLNRFELSNCKAGDNVNLWVAEDAREIFIYRQGSGPGEGKIGVCPDDIFKTIRNAPGCDASIASIYEGGCKIACRLISKTEMAERLKPLEAAEKKRRQDLRKDLVISVDYSAIDSGIYKCFISNKTGMCDVIGTWAQFKVIEERIAGLCLKNDGKYYKTKAKTAKFAIIFDPNARGYSNVASLKNMGYKVTTFEKALEYFGLADLWDCKKMAQHEHDLKKFEYEETFHKPFPLNKAQR